MIKICRRGRHDAGGAAKKKNQKPKTKNQKPKPKKADDDRNKRHRASVAIILRRWD